MLNKYYKQEVLYYLKNYNLSDIDENDLSDVKMIFVKYLTAHTLNRTLFILRNKLFFLLNFFKSHNLEYINEEDCTFNFIDTLSLFSFRIKGTKHFLLISHRHDSDEPQIKNEAVELFI